MLLTLFRYKISKTLNKYFSARKIDNNFHLEKDFYGVLLVNGSHIMENNHA